MQRWYKSSFSGSEGECGNVLVRHSMDLHETCQLQFTDAEWRAFIKGAKAGEFDV